MIPTSDQRPAPRSFAVLHRTGDVVRAVLADTSGQRPQVTAWREFRAAATTELQRWLDDAAPDEVIGILPASAVICRTCTLPNAAPEALTQALALQAEAHMPGAAPEHRMVMATLPNATGETARSGIICAWPEQATPTLPETTRTMTWCPDVAALAAILNGERPADPLLWLDGADGSVALALSHANGAVFRCARASIESPLAWRQSACRVLAETAISVNHTGAFTESLVGAMGRGLAAMPSRGSALIGPDETIASARERIAGTPDEDWWHDFGVAAGAVMARTNELAPLTTLRREAPVLHPSRLQRLTERLGRSSFAARVVTVCVLLVLLAPVVSARLRLALVEARLPDIDAELDAAEEVQKQLAMYEALARESWPMTKLLADIACSTPEGIELDQIRIRHGNDILVVGSSKGHDDASAQGLLARMQQDFRTSGVFTNTSVKWGDPDNFGAYDFSLTATVSEPYRRFPYPRERDFAAWTLADRLYGPDDDGDGQGERVNAIPAAGSGDEPERSGTVLVPPERGGGTQIGRGDEPAPVRIPVFGGGGSSDVGSRGNMADRGAGSTALPPSANIPEPLTALQVAAMNRAQLMEAYSHVAQARKFVPDGDEALNDRLKADFALIRERLRVLNSGDDDEDDDDDEESP